MKITSDQLEKLKSLEEMAAKLRELHGQHDLLVAHIPENWSRQGELRKQIATFPAHDLINFSPAVEKAREELSRVEFLNSHLVNARASVSGERALLEGRLQRDLQEFLNSIRQTFGSLTGEDKAFVYSLTNQWNIRGETIADRVEVAVNNIRQIEARFQSAEVAS